MTSRSLRFGIVLLVLVGAVEGGWQARAAAQEKEQIDRALATARDHFAQRDLSAALLAYSAAFFLFERQVVDKEIYYRIGQILETLAIREPARLRRAQQVFDSCLTSRADDRVCREGRAIARARQLLRPDLKKELQGQGQLALGATELDELRQGAPVESAALFALGVGMDRIVQNGWTGRGEAWGQPLNDLAIGASYKRTSAAAILSIINVFAATSSDPDWDANQCMVDTGDKAQRQFAEGSKWLLHAQTYAPIPDKIRLAAQGRVLECQRKFADALVSYRAALVEPSSLIDGALRQYAAKHHRSLLLYIHEVESEWDALLTPRLERSVQRLVRSNVESTQPRPVSRPVLHQVAVHPRGVLESSMVAAPTGPNDAPMPLVISGEVSDSIWVREIRVLVDGRPVVPGLPLPEVVLGEPMSQVHLADRAVDRRTFFVRLALPPRKLPYKLTVEAVSMSCPAEPCPDHTSAPWIRSTARISGREEQTSASDVATSGLRKGVLLGIGRYKVLGELVGANDARTLRRVLANPLRARGPDAFDYRDVELLLDDAATQEEILTLLKRQATRDNNKPAYEDKILLLYFSGHGNKRFTDQSVLLGGQPIFRELACIIPWDAKTSKCDAGIEADLIAKHLREVKVRGLVAIIDSCHAGDSRALSPEIWTFARDSQQSGGAVVIASSGVSFQSVELRAVEHGLLTAFVLEGLRGKAGRGEHGDVTLLGLWNYIQENVPNVKRLDAQSRLVPFQTPTLTSHDWKEPIVLVSNRHLNMLDSRLTTAQRAGRIDGRRLPGLKAILRHDPDPERWGEVLDQALIEEFALDANARFDELLGLLSKEHARMLTAEASLLSGPPE